MNGLFGLNGLIGFFIAVALLLAIVVGLGTGAILVQKAESTHYYKIEQKDAIQQISSDNAKHRVESQQ